MGIDRSEHTKSGPSGSGFLYMTSFVIATEDKIWTRRADHRRDRISEAIGGWIAIRHPDHQDGGLRRSLYRPRLCGPGGLQSAL
jgi:hypothetical protein